MVHMPQHHPRQRRLGLGERKATPSVCEDYARQHLSSFQRTISPVLMKRRDAIDAILQQSNLIGCIFSPLQWRANAVPVAGSENGAESKCWARGHASSGVPRRCSRKQDLPASQWGREARLCSQANENPNHKTETTRTEQYIKMWG